MRTWNDLKTAVQKANSPQQAAGTFINGVPSIIESNVNDPTALKDFVREYRTGSDSLLHTITGGKSGSVS